MAARGIFGLLSLILIAGGLLLMLFITLAGAVNGSPVNRWSFITVDTSAISGAPALSRWTYWDVCGDDNGRLACSGTGYGKVHPAYPFDPPRNFDTNSGVPQTFISTSKFYLMSRFMFAFMLIALFFGACALLTGVLALCTRLGAYMSGFFASLAALFQGLNAALMTATYIIGRNAFLANNQTATIGKYAFGFEWAAFACFFLAMITFCVGGSSSKKTTYGTGSSRKGFFGGRRSKSTRSRGSFINGDKEYA